MKNKIYFTFLFCFFSIQAFAGNSLKGSNLKDSNSILLRIGVLSGGSPDAVQKEISDFSTTLGARIKSPVQVQLVKTYEEIILALKKNEIDFAFLTPRTFVSAEKQVSLKVLLKRVWDEPFYYSAIFVPKNSKIKNLKDLKGKKIIFVDEYSTSGYLYPLVQLKKVGIQKNDIEIVFSQNHQASIQMLADKKGEAAATFSDDELGKKGAWTKFSVPGLAVKILKVSEPIPNDPFCVRSEFFEKNPQETYRLMSELIDINQDPVLQKKFSNILGSKYLSPATSRQYDPVREMVLELEK